MSVSSGSLSFRSREIDEQKQTGGTPKRPKRQTRRNDAHATSKLSQVFDSSLTPNTLYRSVVVGDETLPHYHDASCDAGESPLVEKASLHKQVNSRPSSAPSGKLSAGNHLRPFLSPL